MIQVPGVFYEGNLWILDSNRLLQADIAYSYRQLTGPQTLVSHQLLVLREPRSRVLHPDKNPDLPKADKAYVEPTYQQQTPKRKKQHEISEKIILRSLDIVFTLFMVSILVSWIVSDP